MTGQRKRTECELRERKTPFVDILRTTPTKTVCPNFYVFAHADGCSFSPTCSYCYLKSSLWFLGRPRAFKKTAGMLEEVRQWIARDDLESFVLNMGNLSDSLVFEKSRPLLRELVEVFRTEAEAKGRPHCLLLVTKGGVSDCRPLFRMKPSANVIVSFSINSREAARTHERGAASSEDRLAAARRLKSKGWRVRIRIDPMIEGFDYRWLIHQVRDLAPERVTMGSLRAEPNLVRRVANGLFAKLVKPRDPKALARYPKKMRLAMYREVVDSLVGTIPLALCEETPDIWKALGIYSQAKACNCGL